MRAFVDHGHRVAREYVGKRYHPDAKPQRDLLVSTASIFSDGKRFADKRVGLMDP